MDSHKEALFLPFMQIPSGHHHVADALIHDLERCDNKVTCDKVDILSYSYGRMEKVVSSSYLAWIKLLPNVYNWLYYFSAYRNVPKNNRNYVYETLFTHFLKRLIQEKKPRIIFCTHALPSNIASILKQKKQLNAIIVNVYTDFFVNRIWGMEGIDYHFVPTASVRDYLLAKGVDEKSIFITGIPVHPVFTKQANEQTTKKQITVLVTGGNLGVGAMERFLPISTQNNQVHYYVLCGKNEKLFQQLKRQNISNVTPFGYITCRNKMNDLYDQVDAVVTKPGGVTISESLRKEKPIFVYNPLPGQERINVEHLVKQGLVMPLDSQRDSVDQQISSFFTDQEKQLTYLQKVNEYQQNLEVQPTNSIIENLLH